MLKIVDKKIFTIHAEHFYLSKPVNVELSILYKLIHVFLSIDQFKYLFLVLKN